MKWLAALLMLVGVARAQDDDTPAPAPIPTPAPIVVVAPTDPTPAPVVVVTGSASAPAPVVVVTGSASAPAPVVVAAAPVDSDDGDGWRRISEYLNEPQAPSVSMSVAAYARTAIRNIIRHQGYTHAALLQAQSIIQQAQ